MASDERFDVLTADEGNLWAWAVENAGIENAATFIREATVKALRAPRPSPTPLECVRAGVQGMRIQEHNASPDDKKDGLELLDDVLSLIDLMAERATPAAEVRDEH